MSWLSALFHGSKTSTPDTSAQEAEAARQAAAEQARLQALLEQQQKMWEQQRADDQKRYDAQVAAQQAEAERQRAAAADLVNRQIAAQQDQAQRQEAQQRAVEAQRESERAAAAQQAQDRATRVRSYSDGRQALIDKARGDITQAYSGFDQNFFDTFKQAFVDQYKPELERNAGQARRETTFGYGDTHNLRSSAAARSFGDVTQQLHANEGKLANSASDAAQSYRNDIEGQKSNALDLVFSAGGVGAGDLPDGTDVGTALGGLGSQLGSITQSAARRAQTYNRPGFSSFAAPNMSINVRKPGSGAAFA